MGKDLPGEKGSEPVDKNLTLNYNGTIYNAAVRTAEDMKPFLRYADCFGNNNPILYYMYRNLDKKEYKKSGTDKVEIIRFDETLIPPKDMNGEPVKTAGHFHPKEFSELYEVIQGQAVYILQTEGKSPSDVVAVHASKGDVVLVPPGYGHVTVNPSKTENLLMANLVSCSFESDYSLYKKLRGAAYYYDISGRFVPNENYAHLPEIRRMKPSPNFKPDIFKLLNGKADLSFLSDPKKAAKLVGWK